MRGWTKNRPVEGNVYHVTSCRVVDRGTEREGWGWFVTLRKTEVG